LDRLTGAAAATRRTATAGAASVAQALASAFVGVGPRTGIQLHGPIVLVSRNVPAILEYLSRASGRFENAFQVKLVVIGGTGFQTRKLIGHLAAVHRINQVRRHQDDQLLFHFLAALP
jgi:hypothetical protein